MKTLLVSGGGGYIGRSTVEILRQAGYGAVILDNFSTGYRAFVEGIPNFEVDLRDFGRLREIFVKAGKIHAIFHFAAKALVSESCEEPESYLRNNIVGSLNLIELAAQFDIPFFVHSSSCGVYGDSDGRPLNEDAKLDPISPYGVSKKMSEEILSLVGNRRGIAGLHLRYFNPAGALNGFNFGECHKPETHLIPSIIYSMIQGWEVPVFGTNYATRDGTCLRDFIHIEDVAQAHLRALQYLERQPSLGWTAINLGSGKTKSVLEVIHCVEKVMGKKITIGKKPPRPGDPPELCADISRASDLLNWVPKRSLEEMIESHYRYEMHRIKDR